MTGRRRSLMLRNVKPGMSVQDEGGTWQTVTDVYTSQRWTCLSYADGTEEEGYNDERVDVMGRPSAVLLDPTTGSEDPK